MTTSNFATFLPIIEIFRNIIVLPSNDDQILTNLRLKSQMKHLIWENSTHDVTQSITFPNLRKNCKRLASSDERDMAKKKYVRDLIW